MSVNIPRNVNDEDLVDGMPIVERPLDQPTSMSYFLQRVRLAELFRHVVDRVPLTFPRSDPISYHQILEVGAKFDKFIEEIPAFFCLDGPSLEQLAETCQQRAPVIIIQRYILNSIVHSQRCKLHWPYLTRASLDPAYAYSRETCLQAARLVIRTQRQLEKEQVPFVSTRLRFFAFLQCVFMAIVVLLLDICVNKGAGQEEARKAEVVDAWRILEDARGQSAMATKLLDTLTSVLRKYKVSLPGLNQTRSTDGNGTPLITIEQRSRSIEPTWESVENDGQSRSVEGQRLSNPGLTYFDEIWQNFDVGMDLDTLDWKSLFSELESQFI